MNCGNITALTLSDRTLSYVVSMTVADLMERLKTVSPEATVYVAGNDHELESVVVEMTKSAQLVSLKDADVMNDYDEG
jgi:hypothetical protein